MAKLGYNKGNLQLTLEKQDGTSVVFGFSKDPPTVQGNIDGLQTKIVHTFTYDNQIYPWILSNGETANAVGTTNTNPLIDLVKQKKIDEEQLIEIIGTMRVYNVGELINEVQNPKLQLQLFEAYRKNQDDPTVMSRNDLDFFINIEDTKTKERLLIQLLEITTHVEDTMSIKSALYLSKEFPYIEDKILEKKGYDVDELINYKLSPELQQRIISHAGSFDSVASLNSVTDPDLKLEIIKKMDFTSGDFADFESGSSGKPNSQKGINYRTVLETFSDDPKALQVVLNEMPDNEQFDFYPQNIAEIFADPTFQEQTKDLDFANTYSVAITTDRLVRRSGKEQNAATRAEATTEIMKQRSAFENYRILDEETYYIPITHEEDWFQNDDMVRIARDSGVTKVADTSLKGSTDIEQTKAVKSKFLTYVSESDEKGKTTIHFSNHGGPDHQWLTSGQAGSEQSDEFHNPRAISYVELGDSLLERGNLGEVTIMIDSCYSNDFKNNLYSYLGEKGSTTLPVVITETNRGQGGWGSVFDTALDEAHTPGKPLTGADIFKVESKTFHMQDLSVTIPATDASTLKWTDTTIAPVIDLGSTNDAGVSLPPTKQDTTDLGGGGVPITQPTPTNVLEIAANEQAAEEAIGFA